MDIIKLTDTRTRQVINKNNKKAFELFSAKQFQKSFELFAHNLTLEPDNTESTIGILLADMAQDFEEQALSLYEYYQILLVQEVSKARAREQILKTIRSFDGSTDQICSAMREFEDLRVDSIDGILYKDFKHIAQGNFKEAFESLLFSTKIIFTDKGEIYEFLKELVENDYQDMSIEYIESLKRSIIYDGEIEKILQKVAYDNSKKHKL